MAMGPGTKVINGQRFDLPEAGAYFPVAFGPQTQGVPQHPPTMPTFYGGGGGAAAAPGLVAVDGYGTADNNATVTQVAAAHPWNLKASPVVWAIGGLLLSIVLLQKIHWRKTIISGEAQLGIGEERAEARAEV